MSGVLSEESIAEFHASKTHAENRSREAMVLFIMKRQVKTRSVLLWPAMCAGIVVVLFFLQEGVFNKEEMHGANPFFLAIIFVGFLMMATGIAMYEAAKRLSHAMVMLEKCPAEKWFTVIGVAYRSRFHEFPVTVTIQDLFNKVTKVTVHTEIDEWKGEDGLVDTFVASSLRDRWGDRLPR